MITRSNLISYSLDFLQGVIEDSAPDKFKVFDTNSEALEYLIASGIFSIENLNSTNRREFAKILARDGFVIDQTTKESVLLTDEEAALEKSVKEALYNLKMKGES